MKTLFDDTRHRWIQLGCGPHPLPSPWENYDREVDITKPLPFPDGSVQFIFAEHVIEHVPFVAGVEFLRECRRVLEPGGTVRICFPDVTRFIDDDNARQHREAYIDFLRAPPLHLQRVDCTTIFKSILTMHGHRSAWTAAVAQAALLVAGFETVGQAMYGDSDTPELRGIERHHFSVPESVAIAETTIIEAIK